MHIVNVEIIHRLTLHTTAQRKALPRQPDRDSFPLGKVRHSTWNPSVQTKASSATNSLSPPWNEARTATGDTTNPYSTSVPPAFCSSRHHFSEAAPSFFRKFVQQLSKVSLYKLPWVRELWTFYAEKETLTRHSYLEAENQSTPPFKQTLAKSASSTILYSMHAIITKKKVSCPFLFFSIEVRNKNSR